MKTAISVPDRVAERVNRAARQHQMNRSQFFTIAAQRYVDDLEESSLTHAINTVLETTEYQRDVTVTSQANVDTGDSASFLADASARAAEENAW